MDTNIRVLERIESLGELSDLVLVLEELFLECPVALLELLNLLLQLLVLLVVRGGVPAGGVEELQ